MNNCERCFKLDPPNLVAPQIELPVTLSWLMSAFWRQQWKRLVHTLIRANEVQVWQRIDRAGNLYWQAYDPATRQSTTSASAAELRAWIEQGYYRK